METPSADKVTIIIVNWNTGKLLRQCLESISRLPDLKETVAEVVVIDNNSHDDSFQQAKIINLPVPMMMAGLPENIGFAAANNMGIRRRRNKDSDVFLLNPDTEVTAGAIAAGLQELQTNAKAGVVGLKLINVDGSLQPSVRAFPTLPVLLTYFLKLHPLFKQSGFMRHYLQTGFDYTQRQVVDQVMGAAFFVRREVVGKVGMLDEGFWIWFEEVDLCKRVQDAGWEIIYSPAGTVMHYGGVSFSQWVGIKKTMPFLNSGLLYAKKHLGQVAVIVLTIAWPFGVLLAIPAAVVHWAMKRQNKQRL